MLFKLLKNANRAIQAITAPQTPIIPPNSIPPKLLPTLLFVSVGDHYPTTTLSSKRQLVLHHLHETVKRVLFFTNQKKEVAGWLTRQQYEKDMESCLKEYFRGKVGCLLINVQREERLVGPFQALAFGQIHMLNGLQELTGQQIDRALYKYSKSQQRNGQ